ncbi:MAG TPA: cellulase family glycosylhydrolase [Devosiaceae bacterium]
MKRALGALAMVLALTHGAGAMVLELRHGVGLHEWLNWAPLAQDGSYRWPPYHTEEEWLSGYRPLSDWPAGDEFKRIRAMGFDFIRLTVDPGPLLDSTGGRRQEALDVLSKALRRVTAAGLRVVFDLHGVTQVPAYSMDLVNGGADSAGIRGYERMVADVAGMLVTIGTDKVAIEPYNEPAYYPCDAGGSDDWQRIMATTVAAVRKVSADLTIVATGACGGDVTGLVDIDPSFDDPNIYYSFHMYEPHSFTHQRLDDPKAFASGLPWPADKGSRETVLDNLRGHMRAAGLTQAQQAADIAAVSDAIDDYFGKGWGPAEVERRLGEAVAWAQKHNIPSKRLFMGEFGAMLMSADGRSGAFDADRLRYLAAVREEAEHYGIPWSIWEYSNPFGMSVIEPKGPAVPDMKLLEALGLEPQVQ